MTKEEKAMYDSVCKPEFERLHKELVSMRKVQAEDHAIITNGLRDKIKDITKWMSVLDTRFVEMLKGESPWVKVLFKVGVPIARWIVALVLLILAVNFIPKDILLNIITNAAEVIG